MYTLNSVTYRLLLTAIVFSSCAKQDTPATPQPPDPPIPPVVVTDSALSIILSARQPGNASLLSAYSMSKSLQWQRSDIALYSTYPAHGYNGANLLAGTFDKIHNISLLTGSTVWAYNIPGQFYTNSTFSGDTVITATALAPNGIMYLLRKDNGAVLWSLAVGEQIVMSPFIIGDKIYCVSANTFGTVYSLRAFDLAAKTLLWRTTIQFSVVTFASLRPRLFGDNIFIGEDSDVMYCINKNTGALVWSRTDPDGLFTFVNNTLYLSGHYVSPAYRISKINLANGTAVWQSAGIDQFSVLYEQKKMVYNYRNALYLYRSNKVLQLNDTSGNINWSKPFPLTFFNPIKLVGNTVIADNSTFNAVTNTIDATKIYFINPADFTLRDSFSIPSQSITKMSVTARSGNLY